jgi:hypothetical protein
MLTLTIISAVGTALAGVASGISALVALGILPHHRSRPNSRSRKIARGKGNLPK